eukprot:1998797-Rhodomonas_salina.1
MSSHTHLGTHSSIASNRPHSSTRPLPLPSAVALSHGIPGRFPNGWNSDEAEHCSSKCAAQPANFALFSASHAHIPGPHVAEEGEERLATSSRAVELCMAVAAVVRRTVVERMQTRKASQAACDHRGSFDTVERLSLIHI